MRINGWPAFAISTIFLCVVMVYGMWLHQPRLVVVDMMRAIEVPSAMLAKSTVAGTAQLNLMSRYSSMLPKVIKAYGETHHVTIISASVFVKANDVDITNEIIQQTLVRLRHDAK